MSERGSPESGSTAPLAPDVIGLDRLEARRMAHVARLDPGVAGLPAERALQLADIGFVPGEQVTVLARAWPGGDPMVVRVGQSRFALRRAEAECVRVQVTP